MKSGKINLVVILGIIVILTASCLKDDSEEKRADEKRLLDNYLFQHNITVQPTPSGLYYIENVAGTGDSAIWGKWIEIKYTGKLVSNNNTVMTTEKQTAIDNGIYTSGIYYGPARLILGNISYAGLNEGIAKMREGGKSTLIFPSDLALGSNYSSTIPSYSSFIFEIELLNVIPDIKTYENGLMLEYLENQGYTQDSTATGIYFIPVEEGSGDFPVTGDRVTVQYTGKFLNGVVFDGGNGKTFEFTIGAGGAIPGFEEGVKMLRKDGRATVVIPYYHAYGIYGRFDSYYRPLIPPFTTLVFDLYITSITKKV